MADLARTTVRQDKTPPIRMGATPVEVLPSGAKIYEGTAAFGDVVAPYPDLDPPRAEFRPADEVMSEAALKTLEGLAFNAGLRARDFDGRVTLPADHPPEFVNPETVADMLEGVVLRGWREDNRIPGDPPELRVRVIAHTAPLQRLIESGVVDLSLGYTTTDVWESGEHNGVPYQVVQRGHRYNHLSLVDRARSRTPDGRAARLDTATPRAGKPAAPATYPRPGEKPLMNPEVLALLAKHLKMDALSAEDAALLAQMSPEAQAKLAAAAEVVDPNAAPPTGDPAPTDIAAMGEMLKAMRAELDALKAAKSDAPKPTPEEAAAAAKAKKDAAASEGNPDAADRKDSAMISNPDAVIAAAQKAASTAAVKSYNDAAAFVGHVRKDGYLDVHTTDQAATVMLATVTEHLPLLKATAEGLLKHGRLDSLRPIYDQAESIRRDSMTRQQGEDVAAIVNGNRLDGAPGDTDTIPMFTVPARPARGAARS